LREASFALPGDAALARRLTERFLADAHDHAVASRAVLADLTRRYRLGVVSNFYGNLETVCADVSLAPLFGVIVDSARVGYSKPDPKIFETALAALGVAADEATFVGDFVARDMRGARDAGLEHIWMAGHGAPAGIGPCCAADPVIRSLGELTALLA
jgi:putative hydrolase of the HAD superfamily